MTTHEAMSQTIRLWPAPHMLDGLRHDLVSPSLCDCCFHDSAPVYPGAHPGLAGRLAITSVLGLVHRTTP